MKASSNQRHLKDASFDANNDRSVYSLAVEDVQGVANEILGRELSFIEIEKVEGKLGDHIPWYDAIESAIKEVVEQ